jgi:hypothetical protein
VSEAAVIGLWLLVVASAAAISIDHPALHFVALFVHLVSLAVGFGAVVVVDVYGLLWCLGRRASGDVLALATMANALIVVGVIGLLVSGTVLNPDLSSPLIRLKLALVLVILVNGVNAHRFTHRLRALPASVAGDAIPWQYVRRAAVVVSISQVAWWGAMAIGFLRTASRLS